MRLQAVLHKKGDLGRDDRANSVDSEHLVCRSHGTKCPLAIKISAGPHEYLWNWLPFEMLGAMGGCVLVENGGPQGSTTLRMSSSLYNCVVAGRIPT